MFNFKIPLYAGITGFILIAFINIIKGNTIFIILSRSIIYGILVFGVFFGFFFVLKKYLDIDLETENADEFESEEENANIDITVGDEELKDNVYDNESYNSNLFNNIEGNEGLEDQVKNYNEDIKKDSFNIEEDDIKEDRIFEKRDAFEQNEFSKISNEVNDNADKIEHDENIDMEIKRSIEDSDAEHVAGGHDKTYELSELSLDGDSIEEEIESSKSSSMKGHSIKDKIGVDVSYEELAKAIRTKIKRDE